MFHHDSQAASFLHSKLDVVRYQFSSVAQSCPTLCDPMNHSTPGLPVHHQLLEFTQTHVHRVGDDIQPSHPLVWALIPLWGPHPQDLTQTWLPPKGSTSCNTGDVGSVPGSGRSPGEGSGNPLQYSCLENPMDRGAWRATVHGVAKSQTQTEATWCTHTPSSFKS